MARRRGHKRRKVCYFTVNKIEVHRLQGCGLAAQVHQRAGENPAAPGDGHVFQVSTAADPGHQTSQTNGASALYHRLNPSAFGPFFLARMAKEENAGDLLNIPRDGFLLVLLEMAFYGGSVRIRRVPEGIRRRPRINSDARLTSLERIGGGRVHEPSGARDADCKEFESD